MKESAPSPPAPATGKEEDIPIPPNLQRKLEEFRNRLWSVKIAEGALAGIVGLGISYLFVFTIDRFIDTPNWVRLLILAIGVAVPAIGIPLRWHNWVWKQRTLEQVARLLRKRHPRLGDQLLGIVQLAREQSAGTASHSNALVDAAMQQVDEKVKDADFSDAVPENRYGLWMAATIGVLAIAGLALLFVSNAAQNAMARWITPWKNVDRYTFAKLEEVPKQVVVPYAEKFDFGTELRKNTEWKPESASIRLPGKTKLQSDLGQEERYDFLIPPQKQDGALKLRVGDATETVSVTPVTRPELTNLTATVRLPDYLLYPEDPEIPVRGGSVSIIKGAVTSFTGETSRELTEAVANGEDTEIKGNTFSTAPSKVTHSQTHELSWKDIHGLNAKSPLEIRVNAVEDQAPDVFAKRKSSEQVILAEEVVSFSIQAGDDYGLRNVGLEWVGVKDPSLNPEPAKGEKLVKAGDPQLLDAEATGTFSAALENVSPQTIQVRAFAEDFLPNRPRSYSSVFVLHVMNPEDHASWLTGEFSKWFRHAREVYEREQQLHESNKDLRKLSAGELDKPENRKKLEKQASAEANNARRLDSLTKSGRDLVRQATKNDEFDAERLESWATMMRALDDIAQKRMPSVADLLKKSSQSVGGGNEPKQAQQESQPSSPQGGSSGSKGKKGEKSQQKAGQSGAPNVANNKDEQQSQGSQSGEKKDDEKDSPKPAVPGIQDKESSMAAKQDSKPEDQKQSKGKGRLSLPSTTLGAAPDDGEKKDQPASPAQQKLDEAIDEQKDLLTEFAKVADQLQDILSSLESSTFVKRLKAASRKQMEVAKTINETISGGFGISKDRLTTEIREVATKTSGIEKTESEKVYTIQSDLDAYYQRKQDVIFKNVLDQMRELSVVTNLQQISDEVSVNLSGRSISAAEYWADTMDRWAEELVAASNCQSCEGGSKDSLPPEIVLKVMKALRDEMDLREQTREMEAVKSGLSPDEYESNAKTLELTQMAIRERVDEIVEEIVELPAAEQNFGKEIQLLNAVSDVMRQARGILSRPNTGAEAIAAETEAIELLLMSKRQKNNGGGGGGGGSPGGGGTSDGKGASLTDIAVGGGEEFDQGQPSERAVGQTTGKAGREFPEEFRFGLDSYFNALESN